MSKKVKTPEWQMAEVSWFNDGSGEGVVRTDAGRDFYVHYSAIDSPKKRKSLEPNQKVKVQVLDDEFVRHVTKVSLAL
jgi:cold shock CspA family protein